MTNINKLIYAVGAAIQERITPNEINKKKYIEGDPPWKKEFNPK